MANPAESPLSPPHAPPSLVGREREQAALREALAAALAGRGSLVLIAGEAGIGKTALAEWTLAEASAQGVLVLVGRCYDLSETPPYGPWRELFDRAPRGEELPVLPAVVLPPERAGEALASQEAIVARVRAYLAALAARQPLLMLLDDLHWADPASLDLLRAVARALADLPLLLLATYRDDEVIPDHPIHALLPLLVREARAERLPLRQLTPEDLRALVRPRYAFPRDDEDRLVTYLAARTEGNPLYAGEILRALEEAALLGDGSTGRRLGDLDAARVPPLLRQVIDGRVAWLGAETRDLLVIAAVLGQEVPLALWAAVSGAAEETLLATAERAVAARLLVETPDGRAVRFAHALIRAALYEGLGALRRPGWHRRAAEALLAAPDPDPDAVAYHLQQAGDPRAVAWLTRAGVRAYHAGARLTASARFAAAAALLAGEAARARERGWLLFGSASLLNYSDPARSLRTLDEVETLALAAGDQALAAHVRFARGLACSMRGEARRGVEEMARALPALEALPAAYRLRSGNILALAVIETFLEGGGPAALAPPPAGSVPVRLHRNYLTNHLAVAGRFREALRNDETSPDMPSADAGARPHPSLGSAQLGIGHAHAALGRPAEAQRALERARAIFLAGGNTFTGEFSVYFELLVVTLPYRADDLAARSRLTAEGARLWAQAAGALTTATHAAQSDLPLALLEGRWGEARRLAEAGRASAISGFSLGAPVALGVLARHQGEHETAWAQVRALHPAGPASEPGDGFFPHNVAALALAADLALDVGDLTTAAAWIAAHGRWLDWSDAVLWRADHLLLRVRHARATGDLAAARQHAEAARARATEPRQPLALLAAHRALGELATAAGHHAEAATHLAAALALAEACAAPFARALTLLAVAERCAATGERERAGTALAAARALLEPLAARPALARADACAARLAAPPAPAAPAALPFGLTAREADVLRLVAQGLTDNQIAARLFVSRYTVNGHTRAIYGKLGVTSRAAATRLALDHGLR